MLLCEGPGPIKGGPARLHHGDDAVSSIGLMEERSQSEDA